jgi:prophage tail gpP-like protein
MANNIFFEIKGVRYTGFTDISINKSLEAFASSFTATLVAKENTDDTRKSLSPIKLQDEIKLYIDKDLVFTGYVETLDINYDSSSHMIMVAGRDKASDLIDSSAKPNSYKDIKSITRLIEKVLADNGYNNITVSKSSSDIDDTLEDGETVSVELGESIFSFLDRYAKKAQILITTDNKGNIVVTREGSNTINTDLISIKGSNLNNIKKASISLNTIDRYRYIEMYAASDNITHDKIGVNQNAISEDDTIRSPRRLIILPQEASKTEILKKAVNWQINVRRAKGLRYNCTVVNYRDEDLLGNLYKVNTLVNVTDDKCDLDGQYLIAGVTYNKSLEGTTTDLTLINKGCFTNNPLSLVKNEIASNFIT